nr:hypothetical protein [Muribaculum intestinale]
MPEAAYTPMGISYLHAASERDARREYSRLRSIARKRVQRIKESSDFSNNRLAQRSWKPLNEMPSIEAVELGLADLKYFLKSPTTLKELRSNRQALIIQKLRDRNFNIAADNIKQFGEFMDWARSLVIGTLASSDEVADLYEQTMVRGIRVDSLKRDFELWLKKRGELEGIPVSAGLSSKEIRKRLGIS